MTTPWRLLITPPARGAWNMAADESILEHIGRGASLPTLRLYAWTPACLSLGHAQPYKDVDMPRLKQRGWETHYLNVSTGNCGSAKLNAAQTRRVRLAEGKAAAT